MIVLKRMARWHICAVAIACFLCLTMGLAQATTPFFWDSIDVDMTLEANGDLLVTETQTYVFTDSHSNERYRYIPLEGISGITDVAVYENNEPLTVETGIRNNNYWIRWRHALTPPEAHTFLINYRVVGGIQVNESRAQLYWNALFPERDAVINRGQVILRVPDALAGQITSFQSEGVRSRDRKLDNTTFEFVTAGPLAPQDALNIRLEFPADALDITQSQTDYWVKKQSPLAAFFSLAGPGLLVISVVGGTIAIRKRCPNCGQFTLERSSRVIQKATRYQKGVRAVNHTCQRCSYDRRFNQTIPRKSSPANSYSGYGGSCSGGGFSGGGFGGGGGSCGGGGGGSCGGGGG
ncbi:MAG: DUF2207 domain-containing protein [Cyanobacteria bacterium P01_H01_bin.21]